MDGECTEACSVMCWETWRHAVSNGAKGRHQYSPMQRTPCILPLPRGPQVVLGGSDLKRSLDGPHYYRATVLREACHRMQRSAREKSPYRAVGGDVLCRSGVEHGLRGTATDEANGALLRWKRHGYDASPPPIKPRPREQELTLESRLELHPRISEVRIHAICKKTRRAGRGRGRASATERFQDARYGRREQRTRWG